MKGGWEWKERGVGESQAGKEGGGGKNCKEVTLIQSECIPAGFFSLAPGYFY